jgi:hypothetical protein
MAFGYPVITAEERPAVFALQTEYRNKIRNIFYIIKKAIFGESKPVNTLARLKEVILVV